MVKYRVGLSFSKPVNSDHN